MEKSTIGKIQLGIGIVLILLAIWGIVQSLETFGKIRDIASMEETDSDAVQIKYFTIANMFNYAYHLVSLSVILIVLSLLFITQGGANTIKK